MNFPPSPRDRLRQAWACLQGRPIIANVPHLTIEASEADMLALEDMGGLINDNSHLVAYMPPGTLVRDPRGELWVRPNDGDGSLIWDEHGTRIVQDDETPG